MAKKQAQKDSSEVYFDTKTKAVMAQTSKSQDNVKGKIAAVREVVNHSSNDDILLVLQHFDNDVDKTIQAFLEGDSADEILKGWNFTGKKTKNNKKKHKKKGQQQQSQQQQQASETTEQKTKETPQQQKTSDGSKSEKEVKGAPEEPGVAHSNQTNTSIKTKEKPNTLDLPQQNDSEVKNGEETKKVEGDANSASSANKQKSSSEPSTTTTTTQPSSSKPQSKSSAPMSHGGQSHSAGRGHNRSRNNSENKDHSARSRNPSESSNPESRNKPKKTIAVLERSVKDLQRTTVPLTRYKNLLDDEYEKACKRLKKTMEEMHKYLNEREEELTRQLKAVKVQGNKLLEERQKKAVELKMMTDRAHSMKESEIADLKAEIKNFVGERKVDEEIGKTIRFQWEDEHLIHLIRDYGEVIPIKGHYGQRRPSVSSITSSIVSHEEVTPLPTPTSPTAPSVGSIKKQQEDEVEEHSSAEIAELAAKLQKSINFRQGGPSRDRGGRYQGRQNRFAREKTSRPDQQQSDGNAHSQPGSPTKQRNARRREIYRQKMHNKAQQNEGNVKDASEGKTGAGSKQESVSQTTQNTNLSPSNSPKRSASGHQGNPQRMQSPNKGQRSGRQGQGWDRGHRNNYNRQRQNWHNAEKRSSNSVRTGDVKVAQENGQSNGLGKGDGKKEGLDVEKGKPEENGIKDAPVSEMKRSQNSDPTELQKDVNTPKMNGDMSINGESAKDENRNEKIPVKSGDALPQRKPRKRGPRQTETENTEAVNGVEDSTASIQ